MNESKRSLRDQLLQKRKMISAHNKVCLDSEIQSRLVMTREYRNCDTVLVYVATKNEIETKDIIFAAFANKKKVAVPKTNDDFSLSFYYIKSLSDLTTGRFNIDEPADLSCKVCDFSNSICITPCLCCDLSGNRIGYGKGCYDRFFANYSGTKISLCYSDDILPKIDTNQYDVPVDMIVSDSFVKSID